MGLSKKAAEAKQPVIKKSIIEWCDQQVAEGKELKILWDGGNDSGYVSFEVDEVEVNNEYTESLIDYMDNILDYGSWAGEFHANGEAVYNETYKQFVGTNYYSEDDNKVIDINIPITIPKELWFENLNIEVETNYDESCSVNVRLLIKNGFLTDKHTDVVDNLEKHLVNEFNDIFNGISEYLNDDESFRSCTEEWTLDRKEGIEESDNLVFNITKLGISTEREDPYDVMLDLTDSDTVKKINNRLNLEDEE